MSEEKNDIFPQENDIEISTIGEYLRSKREEKGFSLKTISQQTKIHIGLLEYLENNELTKLPSKTYVRGFVKSTAKILNIDQDNALTILEKTYASDYKNTKKTIPSYEIRNEAARNTLSTMTSTPLETVKSVTASSTIFLAKAVVGILIIGIIGFNIKNLLERSAEGHLKLPPVFSTVHQKTKPTTKPLLPKSTLKASEDNKEEQIPIKINLIQDKKDLTQKSEITINDVTLKNVSLIEKQFFEDNSISGEKLEEIFPSRYKVHISKGIENVFINALDGDSWVTYKVDNKDIKKYVLRQGRTVFIRGENIRLFLGNVKVLKLIYNNKLIALNMKTGVRNLVFPEEMKTQFMTPLFVFQKDGSVVTSEDYLKMNQKEHSGIETSPPPPPEVLPSSLNLKAAPITKKP